MNWGVVKREGKPDTQVERIKFNAVYASDSQEDQSFSSATPSGELMIVVSNPNVIGQFEPGDFCYLDIIPVPAPAVT